MKDYREQELQCCGICKHVKIPLGYFEQQESVGQLSLICSMDNQSVHIFGVCPQYEYKGIFRISLQLRK